MLAGVELMARPKKGVTKPESGDGANREAVILMKGSAEYVQWLDDLHEKTSISKVQLFRLAMREFAEKHGHPIPPKI